MTPTLTRLVALAAGAFLFTAALNLPAFGQLPDPGIKIDSKRAAFVVADSQHDFLRPEGVTWAVAGNSVTENEAVENIDKLLKAAKAQGIPVFISPHYYYPTDHGRKFEGFQGSGSDWLERYRPDVEEGETVVVSPHKVYGPKTDDLVLQLRKRGIDQVVLAGMSANLCVESHLRELLEQGFEVAVVKDATAAQTPGGEGYGVTVVNLPFLAGTVWTTDEAIRFLKAK